MANMARWQSPFAKRADRGRLAHSLDYSTSCAFLHSTYFDGVLLLVQAKSVYARKVNNRASWWVKSNELYEKCASDYFPFFFSSSLFFLPPSFFFPQWVKIPQAGEIIITSSAFKNDPNKKTHNKKD
jgi:hypothetical protein